jgi:DNA-binding LacI/PurR family transcriptional regulator
VGTAEPGYPEFLERWRGYGRALRAAGIEPDHDLCVNADPSEESGVEAVAELSKRGAPFDAIFAASDVAAIGAMHALQNHGYVIPADVAVVGFDDIPAASLSTPRLTTVAQDPHRAAEMLIDSLIEAIEVGEIRDSLLPVHLTVRDSSVCA